MQATAGRAVPKWDGERRLLWEGRLVKWFRVPASNQKLILSAFEEEGWPDRIDDPLPLCLEIDAKVRLHDTIKRLSRCQSDRLIHSFGDGTGRGVCWATANSRKGKNPTLQGKQPSPKARGRR